MALTPGGGRRPSSRAATPGSPFDDAASALSGRPASPFDRPASPKRLYLGRSFISDGSFAKYAESAARLRQVGSAVHIRGARSGTAPVARRRPNTTVRELRARAYQPPVKIINAGQNTEASYKPAEFSFAAQGYSKLLEVPVVVRSPKTKVVGTFAGHSVVVNPKPPHGARSATPAVVSTIA